MLDDHHDDPDAHNMDDPNEVYMYLAFAPWQKKVMNIISLFQFSGLSCGSLIMLGLFFYLWQPLDSLGKFGSDFKSGSDENTVMVQRKVDDFSNSLKPVLPLDNFTSFSVDDVNEVFSLFGGRLLFVG